MHQIFSSQRLHLYWQAVNSERLTKYFFCLQHYLKVHAKRSHACDCGQAFSTSALLSHHKRACGLQLLCGCGRNFSSVETLQTHARRSAHAFHPTTVQALRQKYMVDLFLLLHIIVGQKMKSAIFVLHESITQCWLKAVSQLQIRELVKTWRITGITFIF